MVLVHFSTRPPARSRTPVPAPCLCVFEHCKPAMLKPGVKPREPCHPFLAALPGRDTPQTSSTNGAPHTSLGQSEPRERRPRYTPSLHSRANGPPHRVEPVPLKSQISNSLPHEPCFPIAPVHFGTKRLPPAKTTTHLTYKSAPAPPGKACPGFSAVKHYRSKTRCPIESGNASPHRWPRPNDRRVP